MMQRSIKNEKSSCKKQSSIKNTAYKYKSRPKFTKEKTLINFPMGLCYVISETARNGYEYDLIDLRVQPKTNNEIKEILAHKKYDVIGLGTLTHSYYIVKPMIEMMKDAGCVQANYSLESGRPEILKAMNKKIDPKWFAIQKRVLDEADIISQTNLVLGYPQETEKTLEETFNICYENDLMPSVGFLLPAPGSLMYDYTPENGFIEDEEEYILNIGERQNMNINMTNMPDGRLEELANYHLKRIRDKLNLNIDDNHLICGTVVKQD